jgi:hypothetical protein|tara:strand:+ start:1047 stop:1559 length:513 start_codon:yes stop_codon:yes gene_type:complete
MQKKIVLKESDIARIVNKVVKAHEKNENITEQLSHGDDNSFTTEFSSTADVDIFGIERFVPELAGGDFNYDMESIDVVIKWRYELELRSWGIKSIIVYTQSVDINGVVNIWGEEEGDRLEEFSLFVDTMGGFSNDEGWVYQDEQNHMDFGSIVPRNVMIDTREKLVTVEW